MLPDRHAHAHTRALQVPGRKLTNRRPADRLSQWRTIHGRRQTTDDRKAQNITNRRKAKARSCDQAPSLLLCARSTKMARASEASPAARAMVAVMLSSHRHDAVSVTTHLYRATDTAHSTCPHTHQPGPITARTSVAPPSHTRTRDTHAKTPTRTRRNSCAHVNVCI